MESKVKLKRLLSHLSILSGLVLFVIWYFQDSFRASGSTENLILIAPLCSISLFFCLWELAKTVSLALKNRKAATHENTEKNRKSPNKNNMRILFGMLAFLGLILLIEPVGFDAATALFIAVFMYIQGERRVWFIILYSLAFAVFVTFFFSLMFPYPMPTLLPFRS